MRLTSSTALWNRMVQELIQNDPAPPAFFQPGVDRVALVKDALCMPGGNNRAAAVALLQKMKAEEQKQLFPELVQLARAAHGPVGVVREIILSLPRNWVLAHLPPAVEAILQGEEYDDYWMFLELYQQLDPALAVVLARRAATHPDPDIRELGFRHLARLIQMAAEEGETEEGETIRNQLGPVWRQQTGQVRERLRGLAEDLSALAEGGDRQVDMTPAEEELYREQAKAAFIALRTGEVDSALAFLRRPSPRTIPRHLNPFLQAGCWERLGDLETALLFMKEAERYDPGQAVSVLTLLGLLQRTEERKSYADRILNNPTSSPDEVYLAAAALLGPTREMSNEEARPVLERIIPSLLRVLQTYRALPIEQRVIPDLDRYIVEVLGLSYERLGDEPSARRLYDEALVRYPDDAVLLTFRGVAQYQENPAAALRDFARAAELGTSLVWPYYFLARHALIRCAYRQAFTQAVRASRQAVPPTIRAELHEMIGIALSMIGESPRLVRQHFEQAIALDPTNERIRRNREIAEERVPASPSGLPQWETPPRPDANATRQALRSEIEDNQERIMEGLGGRATRALSVA